ncbi:hypothetical protein SteCoe_15630 [Stentor coeruleus]|uniref:Uncharacterized protein n=1 Tax=Stentor coeruleus TaxID=5963 RepID=A0A1R2C3A0_9CILI|nr:hypothetical protein SteCoe_15630 [Stentor coeruleus]
MLKFQDPKTNPEKISRESPTRISYLNARQRKLEKAPEKQLLKKKTKRFNSTLPEELIKIYKVSSSPSQRVSELIRKSTIRNKVRKNTIHSQDTIQKTTKFPEINTPKSGKTKAKNEFKNKEDKLEALINNFIDETQTTPRNIRLSKDNQYTDLNTGDDLHYEINLNDFRGRELVAYQKDCKKNLEIEKIRQKNYRRYKRKLMIG